MIKYTILPSVLSYAEFESSVKDLRSREHEYVEVNGLGWRWRTAVPDFAKRLLSQEVRDELALGLGLDQRAVRAMYPMYWDSVIRGPGNDLVPHTDECPEDRCIAIVYFCNLNWRKSWGGEHVLLEGDEIYPVDIVIPPLPNSMLAFVVDSSSWHMVKDLNNHDVMRHAVVGWLNGSMTYNPTYKIPPVNKANTVITREKPNRVWMPGAGHGW